MDSNRAIDAMSADENVPPEFYSGKGETKLTPAFLAVAQELGDEFGPMAIEVKNLVKGKYARTRLRHMFGLTGAQMDQVLVDAGATADWRPRLEDMFGFTFAPLAPPADGPDGVELFMMESKKKFGQGNVVKSMVNTISDELGEDACKRVPVSDFVLTSVKISPGEVLGDKQGFGKLSTLWILSLYVKTGKGNVGIQIVRNHAKIFKAHFPDLLPIGTGANARERTWEDVLYNKTQLWCRNDVMVCLTWHALRDPCPACDHLTVVHLRLYAVLHPQPHQRSSGGSLLRGACELRGEVSVPQPDRGTAVVPRPVGLRDGPDPPQVR